MFRTDTLTVVQTCQLQVQLYSIGTLEDVQNRYSHSLIVQIKLQLNRPASYRIRNNCTVKIESHLCRLVSNRFRNCCTVKIQSELYRLSSSRIRYQYTAQVHSQMYSTDTVTVVQNKYSYSCTVHIQSDFYSCRGTDLTAPNEVHFYSTATIRVVHT